MRRFPYVGTAGVAGDGFPSIPIQIETSAYIARLSAPPSKTFKNALNEAIFRWKAASVWTLLQDFWVCATDVQADALRNVIAAARDATKTGSPTFTSLKGWGGHSASNFISMPFSATGITASSGCFIAGKCDTTKVGSRIVSDAGQSDGIGSFTMIADATNHLFGVVPQLSRSGGGVGMSQGGQANGTQTFAIAQAGVANSVITPSSAGLSSGTVGAAVDASPVTTAVGSGGQLVQLSAFGFMPTCTGAQMRQFLSILNSFLEDVGAYS